MDSGQFSMLQGAMRKLIERGPILTIIETTDEGFEVTFTLYLPGDEPLYKTILSVEGEDMYESFLVGLDCLPNEIENLWDISDTPYEEVEMMNELLQDNLQRGLPRLSGVVRQIRNDLGGPSRQYRPRVWDVFGRSAN